MHKKKWNRLWLILDCVFFAVLLYWLLTPLFIADTGFKIELLRSIANFESFKNNVGAPYFWLFPISLLLYLTPAVLIFKITTVLMRGKIPAFLNLNHYVVYLVDFFFSGLPLLLILLIILKRNAFMSDLDVFTIFVGGMSVVYSIIQLINIIDNFRYLSPSHKSYIALSKSNTAMQQINLQPRLGRFGILHKLLMVFIITNLVIIISLSWLLLGQFKKTIVRSVIATGTVLA